MERSFITRKSSSFDEWAGHKDGIFRIIQEVGIAAYNEVDMADLAVNTACFKIHYKDEIPVSRKPYFRYENDRLTINSGNKELSEFLYVHFQKRKSHVMNELNEKSLYLLRSNIITSEYRTGNPIMLMKYSIQKIIGRAWRLIMKLIKRDFK